MLATKTKAGITIEMSNIAFVEAIRDGKALHDALEHNPEDIALNIQEKTVLLKLKTSHKKTISAGQYESPIDLEIQETFNQLE